MKTNYFNYDENINTAFKEIFSRNNKSISLGYWEDEAQSCQRGLIINISENINDFTNILKSLGLTTFFTANDDDGHQVCIGFEESISFLKYFKSRYLEYCERNYYGNNIDQEKNRFFESYRDFIQLYSHQSKQFFSTFKLKPSTVVDELLTKPIDLLNKEKFEATAYNRYLLTDQLRDAVIQERGLVHYKYAYNSTRFHIMKLSLDGIRNPSKLNEKEIMHFDKHYKKIHENRLTGDALKAAILATIQKEIREVDKKELKEKWLEIQNRYDYKLLAQSQGITTKLLGIFNVKTSSIEALNQWMEFTYPEFMKDSVQNTI